MEGSLEPPLPTTLLPSASLSPGLNPGTYSLSATDVKLGSKAVANAHLKNEKQNSGKSYITLHNYG
jgi:hypothetical protein